MRPKGSRNRKGVKPTTMPGGHLRIFEPDHPLANKDGQVLLHRKILWDSGVQFPRDAVVHHKNGDKADNRLANLELMESQSAHIAVHLAEHGLITNQYGQWEIRGKAHCADCGKQLSGPDAKRCRPCAAVFQLHDECKRGHPLSGDNVYVDPRGRRSCRTCGRSAQLRFRQRHSRSV